MKPRITTARDRKTKELLPVVESTENVSPATRLLEKRRMMYEKQEDYK
jgi:hypothetical protein